MASEEQSKKGTIWIWKPDHPQYGFLSQWYESPFHTGDKKTTYRTAEQYMMHQKALLFKDENIAAQVMATTDPRKAKSLGRKVKNFDTEVWEQHRLRIVTEGSYHKFKHSLLTNKDIKAEFLATGNSELVEASPFDRIWGVGFGEGTAETNRANWGLNLLGKALMAARKRIQEDDPAE